MIKKILKNRWTEVIDVFRVESANINAGEGGPAEIDVKTIHLEDGTVVPRISPQAIFRMVRDYWIERGEKVDIARERPGKPAPLPKCNPSIYIDDDLFGYLMAKKGATEGEEGEKTKRRGKKSTGGISESRPGPIRSIGAVGLFEYPDDTDFLTSIISPTETEAGGAMVTRRIYTNTFILPIWCDARRIGKELEPQPDKSLGEKVIIGDENERERRLRLFFDALFHLGRIEPGSSKPPLSPALLMVSIFNKPNICLYDALQNDLAVRIKEVKLQREKTRTGEEKIVSVASGKLLFSIEPNALTEKCNLYADDIVEIHLGILESFFDKGAEGIEKDIRDGLDNKIKEKLRVKPLKILKDKLLKT